MGGFCTTSCKPGGNNDEPPKRTTERRSTKTISRSKSKIVLMDSTSDTQTAAIGEESSVSIGMSESESARLSDRRRSFGYADVFLAEATDTPIGEVEKAYEFAEDTSPYDAIFGVTSPTQLMSGPGSMDRSQSVPASSVAIAQSVLRGVGGPTMDDPRTSYFHHQQHSTPVTMIAGSVTNYPSDPRMEGVIRNDYHPTSRATFTSGIQGTAMPSKWTSNPGLRRSVSFETYKPSTKARIERSRSLLRDGSAPMWEDQELKRAQAEMRIALLEMDPSRPSVRMSSSIGQSVSDSESLGSSSSSSTQSDEDSDSEEEPSPSPKQRKKK